MDSLDLHRSLFPYLSTGLVYLNHAATSPLSTNVVAAMQLHLELRSEGPIELYQNDVKLLPRLRGQVRDLINAESPDRIALFSNTSDGLNMIVSGLVWRQGERVLLNDMEFPANVYPYIGLKRQGVEIDMLACPDGTISPEMIERAITPRTRVVALSAVQFLTGFRADLSAIGEMCRRKGILFFVDGIQAVGATTVDVQTMKIDMMSAGSQKWQMGPQGTGFLYVSERVQEMVDQHSIGWLSVQTPWNFRDFAQPLAASARRYEGGTLNFIGLKGMNAALGTLLETGPKRIEERILHLTDHLTRGLDEVGEVSLISPREEEHRAGIVTFGVGTPERAQSVFDALTKERVMISLREGLLRVSPHFYNTEEELEKCLELLRRSLANML